MAGSEDNKAFGGSQAAGPTERAGWISLLEGEGIPLLPGMLSQLGEFGRLVRGANKACSLVSDGDVERLEECHVVDSLSLAGLVIREARGRGPLVDIGSGGGFPGIPLKIVLPELEVVLVERSVRKAGFLRRAIGALGLQGVEVLVGEFPRVGGRVLPRVITARAVEAPLRILGGVLRLIEAGGVFLCQSPGLCDDLPRTFHVEHVDDAWSKGGLRRGTLDLVRGAPNDPLPEILVQ